MSDLQTWLSDYNKRQYANNYYYVSQQLNIAQSQLNDLRDKRTQYAQLQSLANASVQSYNKLISETTDPVLIASYTASRAPYLADYNSYKEKIKSLDFNIKNLEKSQKPLSSGLFAILSDTPNAIKVITKVNVPKITYNVGSVREAYFRGTEEFMREAALQPGNKPVAVTNAVNLWAGGYANKGMIQTWSPPNSDTGIKAGDSSIQKKFAGKTTQLAPHGFQFQYNPTNVTMEYSGTPSVDMAYEMSGQDKFNFVGTGTTQSTIGFQILINRVYDMKYYGVDGHLKTNAADLYSPRRPSISEQEAIYNQGTMYDIEFLLRTLLGVTMTSYLRKDYLGGGTADMGFVAAVPVELHLGQNMRYLVWINNIQINHVLFNERMVPLFSTVNISCNRMPDFGQLSAEYIASQPSKETTTTTTPGPWEWGSGFLPSITDILGITT